MATSGKTEQAGNFEPQHNVMCIKWKVRVHSPHTAARNFGLACSTDPKGVSASKARGMFQYTCNHWE